MSKTALIDALKAFDLDGVRNSLDATPALRQLRLGKDLDLLQFCCSRSTAGDPAAADRQLRLAKWLVGAGFDPLAMHTTAPGEDGEEEPSTVSLVWFAVAKAQNNRLARYFLQQGAATGALFAAAWWGNAEIVSDLVQHGDDLNVMVGATPLHMAVDVLQRGVEGNPELGRRRLKLLKEMLRLGADPELAAFNGTTPLHTVLEKGYDLDVFRLLLKYGANPDVTGKDGRTVREIASRKKDKRYFNALRGSSRAVRRAREIESAMPARVCHHCKELVEEGAAHDCWTTTEAALTRDLPEDLHDAWERLRETAADFGEQRIYASHHCIMFARKTAYFFVRPKRKRARSLHLSRPGDPGAADSPHRPGVEDESRAHPSDQAPRRGGSADHRLDPRGLRNIRQPERTLRQGAAPKIKRTTTATKKTTETKKTATKSRTEAASTQQKKKTAAVAKSRSTSGR